MNTVAKLNVNDAAMAAGRDVLKKEAESLLFLAENLDGNFVEAVDLMFNLSAKKGRVIVTGMGKSGHIGAKIAATLASTGTPSFAVHPGEASHGDLGMITEDDAVLAFSHSGETKELGDILGHCARFNIPLIAITRARTSTLGKAANICLENGVTTEACPMNIAPTSSTTATLALGDALAVAIMRRRGFKPEDFANFHPGGKLGSKLSTVSTLMVRDIPLVSEVSTMDKVLLMISEKRLGIVGVTNDMGVLTGIITDGDLRRHMGADILNKTAKDVMSSSPKTITEDIMATAAVHIMQENKITALFVLENKKPVGVLHIHNCLQAGVI
tara:strand:+ start:20182 stop:21165 length:984 start_codon:yes stop_codon:yes gene_type:complete